MGQMASLACRVLLLLLSPPAWLVSGNDLSLVYDLCSPLSSFFLHRRLPVLIWRRGKRGDGEKSSMKGKKDLLYTAIQKETFVLAIPSHL